MSAYAEVKEIREQHAALKGDALRAAIFPRFSGSPKHELWVNRFSGIIRAARNPETSAARGLDVDPERNLVFAERFRAWPALNADLRELERWFAAGDKCWSAAANQMQHAIREKNWERLDILRKSVNVEAYFKALTAGDALPAAFFRSTLKRFMRCATKGRVYKDKDGNAYKADGFPRPRETESQCLEIAFNGAGRWNAPPARYLIIGETHSPPNHNGPRAGKYRSLRELRPVRVRLDAKSPWFEFDVLFHRRWEGCPKDCRIARRGGEWYFVLGLERPSQILATPRKYAALDWRWRKRPGEKLMVAHVGTDDADHASFALEWQPNRRARRMAEGKCRDDGLPPFMPTPEGRREYQRQMDARKDTLKAELRLHPFIGWGGIRRIAENEADARRAACLPHVEWYARALDRFRHMCRVETANKLRLDHSMGAEIAAWCRERGITDVGSPDDGIKEMAEDDNDPNLPAKMQNLAARNRQASAPGQRRTIVEWHLRKAGIRVHRINPWKTSQRCPDCGNETKTTEEEFDCSGCGARWDNFVVATINGSRLARECGDGDTHPCTCSHDGKVNPHHGFPGCVEAVKALRAASRARARARKDKSSTNKELKASPSQEE